MKKRLAETFAFRSQIPQKTSIDIDNLIASWGEISKPELSVYLVHLRCVRDVAHHAHWLAKSPSFVADHELLNEIYTTTCSHFDSVGERCLLTDGNPGNIDLGLQMKQTYKLIQENTLSLNLTDINSNVMEQVLSVERCFIFASDYLVKKMRDMGSLSRGTDNLLAGIEDSHEQFIYKLQRRVLT